MARFEAELTAMLDQTMEQYGLPGYDCSVWQDGREIYRRMAGVEDLKTGVPTNEYTLYNIYSNTKVITCVAAMQLYEQGLFRLEDPISRYFPEMKEMQVKTEEGEIRPAEHEITILDLFRMTAGIGDGPDYVDMGMQFYVETEGACPILRLPEFLARVPLLYEPGTRYRYGIGHEVLAALIEKLSGQEFAAYLEEHIFQPVGMKDTAFSMDQLTRGTLANQYRYVRGEGKLEEVGPANCLIPPILKASASGGLISTVNDYMKFQLALMEGELLLKRETIDLMRRNHLTEEQLAYFDSASHGIGYGLGVRAVLAPNPMGAFGWGGASGSHGSIDPEKRLCIFYMQHVFDTDEGAIHGRLKEIIYAGLD